MVSLLLRLLLPQTARMMSDDAVSCQLGFRVRLQWFCPSGGAGAEPGTQSELWGSVAWATTAVAWAAVAWAAVAWASAPVQ